MTEPACGMMNPRSRLKRCDEKAGHDARSICDYLRNTLLWPTESVFIDNEAFATYYHYQAQPYATLTTRYPSTIGLFASVCLSRLPTAAVPAPSC